MRRRTGIARPWGEALLLGMMSVAGCGGEGEPELSPTTEPVAEVLVEQAPDSVPSLRRFLPDAMQRATRPEGFAHDAHVQIDCAVCHEAPRGHDEHAGVACAGCHRASGQATVRSLSPAECQSCHHGPEQRWTCEHCHETRGALESVQTLAFGVWSAPRSRTLAFDHAGHDELECASCHLSAPALAPAESCGSCHDQHMEAEVRCVSCHEALRPDAHDVDAHLTCSGAGCHTAPLVEALAATRPVCLLCHQEQVEHEVAGNCIDCHRVRPGGAGAASP